MVMVCEIVTVMVMAHNTVANLENIATGGPAIHELVILRDLDILDHTLQLPKIALRRDDLTYLRI